MGKMLLFVEWIVGERLLKYSFKTIKKTILNANAVLNFCSSKFYIIICLVLFVGNGLIDETEFLQWIARIQALREDNTTTQDDDLTQDLVAAFR